MSSSDLQNQNTTTYGSVLFRKQQGALVLSVDRLTFQSTDDVSDSSHEAAAPFLLAWASVLKHQVSPVSYPKALLKLVVQDKSNVTFQLTTRNDLDRIRKDVTHRLQALRSSHAKQNVAGLKRPLAISDDNDTRAVSSSITNNTTSTSPASSSLDFFGQQLDPTALAVTRSTLLAAHPALRQQHEALVLETQGQTTLLSEDDFWQTHMDLVQDEYARVAGLVRTGPSSLLQAHLPNSGRVTIGVEEMRQIFVLYPAVYQAYEEKVPLELSDEQFWRKYLESEYFHRDRGRIGTAARNQQALTGHVAAAAAAAASTASKSGGGGNTKPEVPVGPSLEQQEARAAAVGTDDLFSRYDQKLQEANAGELYNNESSHGRQWGRKLALGQFDLASTMETERGNLFEGRDNHPPNPNDDGRGARVIQKYNRHWAMVLHNDEAVAGSNLLQVARRSVQDAIANDDVADYDGGTDREMYRLVEYAQAAEEEANHAMGRGTGDDYEELTLKNVDAYYAGHQSTNIKRPAHGGARTETDEEAVKRHVVFAKAMHAKTQHLVQTLVAAATNNNNNNERTGGGGGGLARSACFPPADLGRQLLTALTKKMAQDSRTEQMGLAMINKLPESFRHTLRDYFRRSSELLRHFFGLRKLVQDDVGLKQKLTRIVQGMESFYRQMEDMRKGLPQDETGEMMRKMCLPIMDQLDWAFKLHREGTGSGGGGGFVAVEEG